MTSIGPLAFYNKRIREAEQEVNRIRDQLQVAQDSDRAALKKKLEAAYLEYHNWKGNLDGMEARLAEEEKRKAEEEQGNSNENTDSQESAA